MAVCSHEYNLGVATMPLGLTLKVVVPFWTCVNRMFILMHAKNIHQTMLQKRQNGRGKYMDVHVSLARYAARAEMLRASKQPFSSQKLTLLLDRNLLQYR